MTTSRVFYLFGKLGFWGVVALNLTSPPQDATYKRNSERRGEDQRCLIRFPWTVVVQEEVLGQVLSWRQSVDDGLDGVKCALFCWFSLSLVNFCFSSYSLCRTLASARDLIWRHLRSNPSHKLPSSMK